MCSFSKSLIIYVNKLTKTVLIDFFYGCSSRWFLGLLSCWLFLLPFFARRIFARRTFSHRRRVFVKS
jgi:hypothetical protein